MLKISSEARAAVSVLKEIIEGGDGDSRIVFPVLFDWGKFKNLSITHEIVPFMYHYFKKNDTAVSQTVLEFFKNTYYSTLVRCQYLREEYVRISRAFEAAGIGIVPLKGVAFLEDLYAAFPVRTMTDMDVLIAENDFSEAVRIFSSLGYDKDLEGLGEEYWREKQYHIVFRRKGKNDAPVVELHWGLDYKREGRTILPRMWKRLRDVPADGGDIRQLSVEDTFFCLALHLRRFGKTQCLKNIFDAAMLFKKYREVFDWEYVIKAARDGKMGAPVYFLLRQAAVFLSADFPRGVENNLKVPWYKKKLIDRFISEYFFPDFSYIRERKAFLKIHFLLYDSLGEPARYILQIPPEQFCKYYGLTPYTKASERLYALRIPYFFYRVIRDQRRKSV